MVLVAVPVLVLSAISIAATHSAWSVPIPWDIAGPVKRSAASVPAAAPSRLLLSPNPAAAGGAVYIVAPAGFGESIAIHDVSGRIVRRMPCGSNGPVIWDLLDANGKSVAPGVYLVGIDGVPGIPLQQLTIAR
jgi:hypothetical protein